MRIATACVAVIALAAGCTREAPSSAPPSSVPPTSLAPTTGAPSPTQPVPTAIPDRAFLQLADTNGDVPPEEVPNEGMLPPLCGARYASDAAIAAREGRRLMYWAKRRQEAQTPDGTFRQTITSYRSGGAAGFVGQLRAAVENCPTQTVEGTAYRHRLLTGPRHGDESLLVEASGQDVRLISVVRIGAVVMVLYETGWEAGWSADRAVVEAFTAKAVSRLRSWLG